MEGLKPDLVMMDPPRKGAEESVLRAIAECGPSRIVYVSCDVHTQARDVKLLTALGYRLEKVQRAMGLDLRRFDDAVTFKILYELRKCISSGRKSAEEERRDK